MAAISHREVNIQNIGPNDIEEVVELSKIVYDPGIAYERDHLESQLDIFPQGQLCIRYKGKVVAGCSSLMINIEDYGESHSFDEITDEGYIRNHDPNGLTLYGFDVTVHPDFRGMHLGRRLYDARRDICRNLNLKNIMFGGRIPHFYKYADKLSVNDYIDQVVEGGIYDPVLTFQLKNGFTVKTVMENYLPDDKESLSYGTLMEWKNDQYVSK
ncbi:GNAT family N-acetyltransferase [Siminovitchia fortis]|uniref:GNAT family N-acetyltransferase n=1 Tax=Siminovitchia fortis TaxID=254758 RepID=A0A451GCA1_9BACI|nr:GNAT family N-acetyltransferase [Siminovitchia fortis]RWR12861.1 GNAT family N-acetyltransferase [Siminovitchia fortis]WHY80483.1 GNAT family N-acetyltransferase [Siminovitchia fortis]